MRRRSGYGWFELIIGILLVILGVFTFIRPENTLTAIVIVYGLIAVITGISDIIFYVKAEKYTGFGPTISLISGIFSTMAGFMLMVYPGSGKWIMILILPIWFIAHCISHLMHLNIVKITGGNFNYYFTLIINVLGIILGCMMIIWPSVSLFSSGILIGIYLILLGVDSVVIAISGVGSR